LPLTACFNGLPAFYWPAAQPCGGCFMEEARLTVAAVRLSFSGSFRFSWIKAQLRSSATRRWRQRGSWPGCPASYPGC